MNKKIAVIGLGSPHGDDQLGWLLIDALEKQFSTHNDIEFFRCYGSHAQWMRSYQEFAELIFIDAICSDGLPGTLHQINLADLTGLGFYQTTSSHALNLMESLQLLESIYGKKVHATVYGIEIKASAPTTPVSQLVSDSIPLLVKIISSAILSSG